jgi:hypothetical protein
VPDFVAGAVVLEAVGRASLHARERKDEDNTIAPVQVVHAPELAGCMEGLAVVVLGAQAAQAGGLIEITDAVQSPGAAHVILHGNRHVRPDGKLP